MVLPVSTMTATATRRRLDSYNELEAYLAKVEQEISDAFADLDDCHPRCKPDKCGTWERTTSPPSSYGVISEFDSTTWPSANRESRRPFSRPPAACNHCGWKVVPPWTTTDVFYDPGFSVSRTPLSIELGLHPPPQPPPRTAASAWSDTPLRQLRSPRSSSMPRSEVLLPNGHHAARACHSYPLEHALYPSMPEKTCWTEHVREPRRRRSSLPSPPPRQSRVSQDSFAWDRLDHFGPKLGDAILPHSARSYGYSKRFQNGDMMHWCPHCHAFMQFVDPPPMDTYFRPVSDGSKPPPTSREMEQRMHNVDFSDCCVLPEIEPDLPKGALSESAASAVEQLSAFVATLVDQVKSFSANTEFDLQNESLTDVGHQQTASPKVMTKPSGSSVVLKNEDFVDDVFQDDGTVEHALSCNSVRLDLTNGRDIVEKPEALSDASNFHKDSADVNNPTGSCKDSINGERQNVESCEPLNTVVGQDDSNGAVKTPTPDSEPQPPKSRDVGEFMRQLETSILVASNFLNSSWPTEKDVSILCQKPFLKMTLVADAVTQTSPRASRSSACYWECGCRPDEECIHHRELWWPSGSVDALDGSVNDKLSAADRTEASLDDILQASALEQCDVSVSAENSWRSSQSSSSRSLSESLDNLTPVGSASDEDDGSFASCSLTSSSSETLELPEGAALKESSPVWRQQESGRRQTFLGALLDKEPIVSDFGIERFDKETTKDSRRLNSTDRVRLSGSASTIPNSFTLTEDTKFRTVPVIKNRNPHETAIATVAEDSGKTQSEASPLSPSATHVWLLDINKSSSAPVLGERPTGSLEVIRRNRGSAAITNSQAKNFHTLRSQSAKELYELEAVEACKWLRATGFPQYAQMFEDMQFPIDISSVHKDHYFLDNDSLQSLYRRLNALNRCARMRLDNLPRKRSGDDSDEENQCALSENWKFQRQSRRWSRIPGNFEAALAKRGTALDDQAEDEDDDGEHEAPSIEQCGSSYDSVLGVGSHRNLQETDDSALVSVTIEDEGCHSAAATLLPPDVAGLKRSNSERIKDGAKALLRRVESLKSRRSKRKTRNTVAMTGQHLDVPPPDDQDLAFVQVTPPDTPALTATASGGSSSPSPSSPLDSVPHASSNLRFFGGGPLQCRADGDPYALSDSECSPTLWRCGPASPTGPTGRCYIENFLAPDSPRPLHDGNTSGAPGEEGGLGINYRTGSFNLGGESGNFRERLRAKRVNKRSSSGMDPDRQSLYDNVPVVIFNQGYTDESGDKLLQADHSSELKDSSATDIGSGTEADSGIAPSAGSDHERRCSLSLRKQQPNERRDSGVGLSLTRTNRSPSRWQTSSHCHRPSIPCRSVPLNELTNGQMMVIKKLALLKLTALMERHSPSNRSGWNWAMPKFIKRMKTPDYKDKTVFGVPLVVVLQRTGSPLPPAIQDALRYIRKNAIDAVGIFRKSGVRSRIQKLRHSIENTPSAAAELYEEQQPFDIADLVKQYFRELPEALLTNKMSETFIAIYQHIKEEDREEALQAAVILLPDENREALQALLSFLNDVSIRSAENQMTASNLAVCFAPSLFHTPSLRSQSTSPRRRKTVGVPDQRELNENRAAHDCLNHMITDFNGLFSIPDDILAHFSNPYLEQWHPPSIEELLRKGGEHDWAKMVEDDMQWILKEVKEKFKGWINVSTMDNTELAFRKVGDGNLLRMWKVAVEVEAPPVDSLNRVVRERHLWDTSLIKWRTIERLDKQTEVFQYVCSSMTPLPARDYCVLRSWKTDLAKGACILIESSVEHRDATPLLGGVRGLVLSSRYLIEPCGSGKSKVTYISRVDTRGRSPEWYNKSYGQTCSLFVSRLRESLQHAADGPESKV